MIIIYQTDPYDAGYRVKELFFLCIFKISNGIAFCIECHRSIIHKIAFILNWTNKKNFTELHLAFSWNEALFNSALGELES